MTFPPQPPREADWSTWGTFLHNTASASWPIWPSGGDDSVSIRTALAGGARTILLLPGQTYSFTTSIGEDMVDINQSLTIIAWGATCLITGAGLATTPQFTPDPTVKWLFFPNTASASVNGKTSVTVDTTTRTTLTGGASGASSHRLRIFGGTWDGQGGNVGLVFGNIGPTRFDGMVLKGLRVGISWFDYQDANEIRRTHFRSPNTDAWMMWQIQNGDGIVMDGLKCDSKGGMWRATNCHGGEARACVGGHFSFTNCTGITLSSYHLEMDNSAIQTAGIPGIDISNSQVRISDAHFFGSKYAGISPIDVNDVANERHSEVVIEHTRFRWYYRSGESDVTRPGDVNLASLVANSVVTFEDVSGLVTVQGGDSVIKRANWRLTSGDAAITAALGAVQGQVQRPTTLRQLNGAWVFEPSSGGVRMVRVLTAPNLGTVTTASAAAEGLAGTLTPGTRLDYIAAMLDEAGLYTNLSAALIFNPTNSLGVGASGSVRLAPTLPGRGTLRLWRKAGAGVGTTPDRYVDLPIDATSTRLYDTGAAVNGIPWITTGIPIPNTVAATNQTYDRIIQPGGLVQATGAGTPEGVIIAPVGSTYARTDGVANATLYVKESGTGATGWAAK
jgi:hypothetical protein